MQRCAKDVEPFDDIFRNFIDETNKYEGWLGKIRVKPESLLNYRLRGITQPYEELLIALENIITDKVTAHSVPKVKNIDTSAPTEICMAAGSDGEEAFEAWYGKASALGEQTVYKGIGAKGGWNGGKGSQLECTEVRR